MIDKRYQVTLVLGLALLVVSCRANGPELFGTTAIFVGDVRTQTDAAVGGANVTLVFTCDACQGLNPITVTTIANDLGRYRLELHTARQPYLDQGTAKLLFEAPGFDPDSVTITSVFKTDGFPVDSFQTDIQLVPR